MFGRRVGIEIGASILGAAIVASLVDVARLSPYWLVLLVPLIVLWVVYGAARQRLQVFRSGLRAYHTEFPIHLGKEYWKSAQTQLCYWGVTGASIQEELRTYLLSEESRSVRYRFLLMSPGGKAIREQIAFKRGFPVVGRSTEQETSIDAEVAVEKQRFAATVAVLKGSLASKESPSRVDIREFDEFLPWWLYVIDGATLVVGVLREGRETTDEPAAVLVRNHHHATLFDCFAENFERVWRSGSAV